MQRLAGAGIDGDGLLADLFLLRDRPHQRDGLLKVIAAAPWSDIRTCFAGQLAWAQRIFIRVDQHGVGGNSFHSAVEAASPFHAIRGGLRAA